MKSGFADPIKSKIKEQKKKTAWDFRCPEYDERSSNFIDTGSHFGIGHRNPVGHEGKPKMRIPTLPFGRIKTMRDDEVPTKDLDQDYVR